VPPSGITRLTVMGAGAAMVDVVAGARLPGGGSSAAAADVAVGCG